MKNLIFTLLLAISPFAIAGQLFGVDIEACRRALADAQWTARTLSFYAQVACEAAVCRTTAQFGGQSRFSSREQMLVWTEQQESRLAEEQNSRRAAWENVDGRMRDLQLHVSPSFNDFIEEWIATSVPPALQPQAEDIVFLMQDFKRVQRWILQVRREVLNLMWDEGIRKIEAYAGFRLREDYLERVLASHVGAQGFTMKSNGRSFAMFSDDEAQFFSFLAHGRFFTDWGGQYLGSTGPRHHVHSHPLQMAFAADHIPNFIELVRWMGRNKSPLWLLLFDKASADGTPFWGGTWVEVFGPALSSRR